MQTVNNANAPVLGLASVVEGRRWAIAGVLFLAVISAFFDRISIALLFTNTTFQQAMGTGFNPARLSLLMTGFLFAYGISGVVLGFLGDVFGPRRCLIGGALLWGISMALMGATNSFGWMLLWRVLLGVAEGPQFSLTNALVKKWFPPKEQARANAIWLCGSPLGSAIGFALTIMLVSHFGWRGSFFAYAMLNLIIILPLIFFFIKDEPKQPVMTDAGHNPADEQLPPLAVQVKQFLTDPRFWAVTIFNTGGLVYLWGLNTWLPSYLVRIHHFDLQKSGIFASLPFILMFFGMVGSSALSDKLLRRALVSSVAMFGAALSAIAVIYMPTPHGAALMVALSAGCWGAAMPPQFALALRILPRDAVASGIGVHNGLGNVVGAFSPLLIGMLIQYTGNFNAGMMVLPAAALVAAISMSTLIKNY